MGNRAPFIAGLAISLALGVSLGAGVALISTAEPAVAAPVAHIESPPLRPDQQQQKQLQADEIWEYPAPAALPSDLAAPVE